MLTKKQSKILDLFGKGENIFITGPGGCGKSFIIDELVNIAICKNLNYAITATTGCAAILLGYEAKTINAWAGIGNAEDLDNIVEKLGAKTKQKKKWLDIDVLIIDEVSMLSKKIFELLDRIGKTFRIKDKPFGGIQVIFCGDFYQLPPVGKENTFCFESKLWSETFGKNQIHLKRIFRQKDKPFQKILNQVREGVLTKNTCDILQSCVNKDKHICKSNPVKLLPKINEVEYINNKRNNEIEGKSHEFDTLIYESHKNHKLGRLIQEIEDTNFQKVLSKLSKSVTLKVGSQVMSTVNKYEYTSDGNLLICNGSCGIVVGFEEVREDGDIYLPIVEFDNEYTETIHFNTRQMSYGGKNYSYRYMPLILSWAMTIHKSQGASLETAEINIGSDIFECGQSYVALSRVKSLEGLYLTAFNFKNIRVNGKVKNFYENIS